MKTLFPFKIEIDNEIFNLTFKELNKKNSNDIKNKIKELKNEFDTLESIKNELESLKELKNLNLQILANLKENELTKTAVETKEILKNITLKQKELKALEEKEIDFDAINKQRFDLSISGEDVNDLKNVIEQKGISYTALFNSIEQEIEEQRQKK